VIALGATPERVATRRHWALPDSPAPPISGVGWPAGAAAAGVGRRQHAPREESAVLDAHVAAREAATWR
jgi:hypothetical protein